MRETTAVTHGGRRLVQAARRLSLAVALIAGAALALPAGASAAPVWLCKPGGSANPCEPSLRTTVFSPSGKKLRVQKVRPSKRRRIDCFYVYPTVSDQPTPQATLAVDDELQSIALYQAARYSRDCRVFAPVYRQITIAGLLNPTTVTPEMRETGYADVRDAWRTYLSRHNRGRGFVLVSHSQGTRVLRQLVAEEIDPKPAVRRRLVSALLLGGNVTVAEGKDSGGDFERVRACRSAAQLGCVIAFSAFDGPVPEDSRFGRTTEPGLEVLCNNPAGLGGGTGKIDPVYPTEPFAEGVIGALIPQLGADLPSARTPWIAAPGSYRARCSSAGDADVLQVTPLRGAPELSPVPDPTWGLHLADANLPLGNLADLVRAQAARYLAKRS